MARDQRFSECLRHWSTSFCWFYFVNSKIFEAFLVYYVSLVIAFSGRFLQRADVCTLNIRRNFEIGSNCSNFSCSVDFVTRFPRRHVVKCGASVYGSGRGLFKSSVAAVTGGIEAENAVSFRPDDSETVNRIGEVSKVGSKQRRKLYQILLCVVWEPMK